MTTIDGDEIQGVTIDGDQVQQITVDGDVVWVAIDPPSITSTSSTHDSITMNWSWSGDESRLSGFRCYLNGSFVDSVGPSSRGAQFTNLNPETTYTVGVAAEGTTGIVTDRSSTNVTTQEAVSVLEDFSHNNIPGNYGGEVDRFTTSTAWSYSGSYSGASADNVSGDIGKTTGTVSRGDTITVRTMFTTSAQHRCGFHFAVQDAANPLAQCYTVRLYGDSSGAVLLRHHGGGSGGTTNLDVIDIPTSANTVYRYVISYGSPTITASIVNDSTGSTVGTLSASDSSYGSGGIGFMTLGAAGEHWDYVVRE
jgi:hypothetical protein